MKIFNVINVEQSYEFNGFNMQFDIYQVISEH